MEKNSVKKKRGSVGWVLGLSWLSTLLLAILAIFLMLLTTICSEGFMRKQVTRSSFADYAYSYLYDNYVSYGASTGFDADVMTSTLSRDQINTDMEQAVTDLYAGNTAVNARENVKTDLNTVLVADLNSRGKDVTEDVVSAVEIVADACRLARELEVENLVLYHTEDKNLPRRKELYTREGREYFAGGLYIPDDLERIQL